MPSARGAREGVSVPRVDHQGSHAVEILGREGGLRRDIRPHGPAGLFGTLDQCSPPRRGRARPQRRSWLSSYRTLRARGQTRGLTPGRRPDRTHQRTSEVRSPIVTSSCTGLAPRRRARPRAGRPDRRSDTPARSSGLTAEVSSIARMTSPTSTCALSAGLPGAIEVTSRPRSLLP